MWQVISMENIKKTLLELWKDYLFLTTEMEKFLDKQDYDMFFELVSQRERLQSMIESRQQQYPNDSLPGKGMLAEINSINQVVMNKLRYAMNREDKQHNISRAYDGYGANSLGISMEWKS